MAQQPTAKELINKPLDTMTEEELYIFNPFIGNCFCLFKLNHQLLFTYCLAKLDELLPNFDKTEYIKEIEKELNVYTGEFKDENDNETELIIMDDECGASNDKYVFIKSKLLRNKLWLKVLRYTILKLKDLGHSPRSVKAEFKEEMDFRLFIVNLENEDKFYLGYGTITPEDIGINDKLCIRCGCGFDEDELTTEIAEIRAKIHTMCLLSM